MTWLRDLERRAWESGRFVIRIVGRQYVLEHPDLPRKLKYSHPDMAKGAAVYLVRGGVRP